MDDDSNGSELKPMDTLLTVKEVAAILNISPTTAKIWASQRRFPVVKVGRLVRVTPDALEAWIRENTTHERSAEVARRRLAVVKKRKPGFFESLLDPFMEEIPEKRRE